jgi:hypothetical protein
VLIAQEAFGMTATSEPRLKITYATLRNDNEQLHASYDAGLAVARAELGGTHGVFINGEWRAAAEHFEKRSPIDGVLVGRFAKGTRAGPTRPGRSGSRSCAGWPTSSASGRWSWPR